MNSSDDWQKRENAADAAMRRLCGELPAALQKVTGHIWRLRDGEHARGFTLERSEGCPLSFFMDGYRGKLNVSMGHVSDTKGESVPWSYVAAYNAEMRARESEPRMSCSPDKSAEVVAKDVARRILPALDAAWPRFQEYLKRAAAGLDARKQTLLWLQDMGGTVVQDSGGLRDATQVYFGDYSKGGPVIRVKVRDGGTVEIHETLPGNRASGALQAVLDAMGWRRPDED